MDNTESKILDEGFIKHEDFKKRRSLLPWWIKTFIWIFLVLGLIAPIGLIFGLLGFQFQIALYGLGTTDPTSIDGLYLMGLFILKGITAFGLWTEKDWAITLGQIDAILGIIICAFMMMIYPFFSNQTGFHLNIRLELLLLIPFLLKLGNIKSDWNKIN